MTHSVHFDYASTAPLHSAGRDVIMNFAQQLQSQNLHIFDPRRLYEGALTSRYGIEKARQQVASFIGCDPFEVIFTSSHSESLVHTVYGSIHRRDEINPTDIDRVNVVLSPYESNVVLVSARREDVDVRILPGNSNASISLENVENLFNPNTLLVSLSYAHPDTGTLQNLEEIIPHIREHAPRAIIHVDGRMAVGYCDIQFNSLDIDILTFEPVSLGALAGVGILLLSRDARIHPLLPGATQERARRAGLENYCGIVVAGEVCEAFSDLQKVNGTLNTSNLHSIRNRISSSLCEAGALLLDPEPSLTHVIAAYFPGIAASAVVAQCSRAGINIHAGSSCGSEEFEPSAQLQPVTNDIAISESVFRLSWGHDTTEDDVDYFLTNFRDAIRMFVM